MQTRFSFRKTRAKSTKHGQGTVGGGYGLWGPGRGAALASCALLLGSPCAAVARWGAASPAHGGTGGRPRGVGPGLTEPSVTGPDRFGMKPVQIQNLNLNSKK